MYLLLLCVGATQRAEAQFNLKQAGRQLENSAKRQVKT